MQPSDEQISDILGQFAFHLYDTHGIPPSEIERIIKEQGLEKVVALIFLHKDFIEWNRRKYAKKT